MNTLAPAQLAGQTRAKKCYTRITQEKPCKISQQTNPRMHPMRHLAELDCGTDCVDS